MFYSKTKMTGVEACEKYYAKADEWTSLQHAPSKYDKKIFEDFIERMSTEGGRTLLANDFTLAELSKYYKLTTPDYNNTRKYISRAHTYAKKHLDLLETLPAPFHTPKTMFLEEDAETIENITYFLAIVYANGSRMNYEYLEKYIGRLGANFAELEGIASALGIHEPKKD